MDKKTVKEEVNRFRSQYREVHYSSDMVKQKKPQPEKSEEPEKLIRRKSLHRQG